MKRNIFTALVLAFAIIATSASQRHDGVHSDFEKRKAQTAHRNLYDVFSTAMTDAERNAMEFLYAYTYLTPHRPQLHRVRRILYDRFHIQNRKNLLG